MSFIKGDPIPTGNLYFICFLFSGLALKSNSVATVGKNSALMRLIQFWDCFASLFLLEDAAALPPAIMVDDGVSLPRFMATVKNQTITAGRAARLTCRVENLGNYKVAWVRVGKSKFFLTKITETR